MAKKAVKKDTRNRDRVTLPNGCQFTQPYISPANWESSKASVNRPWFIRFTYYDPIHRPNGKEIKWEGMNGHKTLTARQESARQLLDGYMQDLNNGYNPVTKKDAPLAIPLSSKAEESGPYLVGSPVDRNFQIITPDTGLLDALHWAEINATWGDDTRQDISTYMSLIYPAIRILKYEKLPLGQVLYQHIDNILAQAYTATTKYNHRWKREVSFKWSNYQKNRAKSYLSSHFGVMKKKKVLVSNPCSGMDDLPWEIKEEDQYSPEELREITRLLWEADPDYALFMLLFYDSGARETEFLKLTESDVDLEKQVFKRQILKGQHNKKRKSPTPKGIITDAALPYWEKLLAGCPIGHYLFSRGFRPGPKPIGRDNINTRWQKIIKPHFPDSRPYLMKHTNLTSITDKAGENFAAAKAGHSSTDMIRKHYDKRKDQRNHEVLKATSSLHLLGAPEVLLSGLPSSAPCAAIAVPADLIPPPPPCVPCPPCHLDTLAPCKPYKSLQAA